MKNNGTKTFDWDSRSGTHTLVAEGQVNRLTKKTKTVVLARVHNDPKGGHGDDLTVFRLEGDTLYVTDPHKGQDEDHAYTVTKNFELNTRYTLKIEVKNGKARYWYDGNPVEHASVTVKDPAAVSSAQRGATRVGAGGSGSNRRPTAYKTGGPRTPWPLPAPPVAFSSACTSPLRTGSRCVAPCLMPRVRIEINSESARSRLT
jgi:hypothetical protein